MRGWRVVRVLRIVRRVMQSRRYLLALLGRAGLAMIQLETCAYLLEGGAEEVVVACVWLLHCVALRFAWWRKYPLKK